MWQANPSIQKIADRLLAAYQEGKKEGEAHKLRLLDLVRYQRAELHEAGLITMDEYAMLAGEKGSRERLENYDDLRERIKTLEEALKPFSGYATEVARFYGRGDIEDSEAFAACNGLFPPRFINPR